MSVDLATLGLSVDSQQVRTATRDLDRMPRSAQRAERGTQRLTRQTDLMTRSFVGASGAINRLVPALGGFLTAAGLSRAAQNAVRAFATLERQQLVTEQVIRATGGAAGRTARQLEDMAQSIANSTLASSTEVREAQQQLMTFRSVAGETFDETIRLAQDLATVGFGSISSNAVSMARALEDPRRGLDALRRSGITFTAAQTDMINALADSGRELEAQQMILGRIREQVGGAGAAAGGGLSGAYNALSNEVGNFIEVTGQQIATLSRLETVMRGITSILQADMAQVGSMERLLGVDRPMAQVEADIARRAEALERLRQAEEGAFGGTGGGVMRQQIEALEAAQRADQELVARERLRQGLEEMTATRRMEEAAMERQSEAQRTVEQAIRSSAGAAREQANLAAQTIARLEQEIELFGQSELARRLHQETTAQGIALYSEEGQRISDLVEQLYRLEEAQAVNQAVAQEFGSAMTNALSGLITGSQSAEQAIQSLLRSVSQLLLNRAFQAFFGGAGGGLFGGGFADGAAFGGGNVIPFARGGVVNGPTMFPMAGRRTGLMGEAGPEAIMPLSRGSDGKLGVRAQGGGVGGGVSVTINQSIAVEGDAAGSPDQIQAMAQAFGDAVEVRVKKVMQQEARVGGALNPVL